MHSAGTTLVEVKSGYGMNSETEIKMLEVIEMARRDPDVAVDISTTYCGAHSIPKCVMTNIFAFNVYLFVYCKARKIHW